MFQSAPELLAYANHYLDSLDGNPPRSAEEAGKRVREIRSLISDMRRFNFHAPKFGIRGLLGLVRREKEEILESLPLLQEFIYSLNIRRWTYERAKVAYLANRLAAALLRGKWLIEYLPFLPYGGGYLYFTEKGGGSSYLVFRDLESVLKGEKRMDVLLRGERPLGIRERRERGRFSQSSALLLSSLSVGKAVEEGMEEIIRTEGEEIPLHGRVEEYERIVSRYDIHRLTENPELLWELLQELEEAGFLEDDGTVKEEILSGLRKKQGRRYRLLLRLSASNLTVFITAYYLYFSPWRGTVHPLRGIPKDPGDILDILSPVGNCSKEALGRIFLLAKRIGGRVPLSRRVVAEALLNEACPGLGRAHPGVSNIIKRLSSSSPRAEKFLEALKGEENKED